MTPAEQIIANHRRDAQLARDEAADFDRRRAAAEDLALTHDAAANHLEAGLNAEPGWKAIHARAKAEREAAHELPASEATADRGEHPAIAQDGAPDGAPSSQGRGEAVPVVAPFSVRALYADKTRLTRGFDTEDAAREFFMGEHAPGTVLSLYDRDCHEVINRRAIPLADPTPEEIAARTATILGELSNPAAMNDPATALGIPLAGLPEAKADPEDAERARRRHELIHGNAIAAAE